MHLATAHGVLQHSCAKSHKLTYTAASADMKLAPDCENVHTDPVNIVTKYIVTKYND